MRPSSQGADPSLPWAVLTALLSGSCFWRYLHTRLRLAALAALVPLSVSDLARLAARSSASASAGVAAVAGGSAPDAVQLDLVAVTGAVKVLGRAVTAIDGTPAAVLHTSTALLYRSLLNNSMRVKGAMETIATTAWGVAEQAPDVPAPVVKIVDSTEYLGRLLPLLGPAGQTADTPKAASWWVRLLQGLLSATEIGVGTRVTDSCLADGSNITVVGTVIAQGGTIALVPHQILGLMFANDRYRLTDLMRTLRSRCDYYLAWVGLTALVSGVLMANYLIQLLNRRSRPRVVVQQPILAAPPATPAFPDLVEDTAVPNPSEECIICYSRRRCTVFLECGHRACCVTCGKTLLSKPQLQRQCPVCRRPIQRVIRVYEC